MTPGYCEMLGAVPVGPQIIVTLMVTMPTTTSLYLPDSLNLGGEGLKLRSGIGISEYHDVYSERQASVRGDKECITGGLFPSSTPPPTMIQKHRGRCKVTCLFSPTIGGGRHCCTSFSTLVKKSLVFSSRSEFARFERMEKTRAHAKKDPLCSVRV
jgi:hypothetical protein